MRSPTRRIALDLGALALIVFGLPWLTGPIGALITPPPANTAEAPAPTASDSTAPDSTPPAPDSAPLDEAPRDPPPGERAPLDHGDLFDAPPAPDAAPAARGDALGDDDLFGDGDPGPTSPDAPAESGDPLGDALFADPEPAPPSAPERTPAHAQPDPTPDHPAPAGPDPLTLSRATLGSLLVGLLTAVVATLLGGLLGLISGYRGGLVERVAVRWFADGLDALPQFVVLVTAVALYRDLAGTEGDALLLAVGVLIGAVNSTQVLLVVHHQTRLIAARKYVIAARLMGWSALRVVRRKIVPHLRHELIIPFTQLVVWGLFVETALSYLGFGPSSTGSTLGAQLHRIDPFARPADLAPALVMCLLTVALAAALRDLGDAIEARLGEPEPPTTDAP